MIINEIIQWLAIGLLLWSSNTTADCIKQLQIFEIKRRRNTIPNLCRHEKTVMTEPHLAGARKCLGCGAIYNPNRAPNWQMEEK